MLYQNRSDDVGNTSMTWNEEAMDIIYKFESTLCNLSVHEYVYSGMFGVLIQRSQSKYIYDTWREMVKFLLDRCKQNDRQK